MFASQNVNNRLARSTGTTPVQSRDRNLYDGMRAARNRHLNTVHVDAVRSADSSTWTRRLQRLLHRHERHWGRNYSIKIKDLAKTFARLAAPEACLDARIRRSTRISTRDHSAQDHFPAGRVLNPDTYTSASALRSHL